MSWDMVPPRKETELMVPVGFEMLITLTAKAVVNEAIPEILRITEKQTDAAINSHSLMCGGVQERIAAQHREEREADNKRHEAERQTDNKIHAAELVKVATDRDFDRKHNKPILSRKQWAAIIALLTAFGVSVSGLFQALMALLNRL